MAGRHRAGRVENFGVRRWLQLGAASAGMSAALWGMSVAGPQVGVALADDGDSASSSSSSSSSSDAGSSKDTSSSNNPAGPKKSETTKSAETTKSSSAENAKDADDSSDPEDADGGSATGGTETPDTKTPVTQTEDTKSPDTTIEDAETQDASPKPSKTAVVEAATSGAQSTSVDTAASTSSVTPVSKLATAPTDGASTQLAAAQSVVDEQDSLVSAAALPTATDPWGMSQTANAGDPWQQNSSAIIAATTSNIQFLINSMPVPPELRDALTGTLWTMRRAFFNLAPTMNETYSVSSGLGTIAGRATATDPENDQIQYRVVQGPLHGTLALSDDGSYTYTATADFDGVDTFVIAAIDLGLHVNLVVPFRGAGASASMLVNQNAIDFEFSYNDPNEYFTEAAKDALYQSAKRLAVYFLVGQKTVLTYTVKSEYIQNGYLASAGSGSVSTEPGFWGTVVQEKLLNGVDANGATADGDINWNWAYDWGFYPSVGSDQYDFTSTAMHELLHSFGWLADFESPGDTENTNWYTYSQFVTTKDGDSPLDPQTYLWNSDYNPYLTGYGGGMFFSGANAMAAYGGRRVPLWTPTEWSSGSSISHLDDDTFSGPNHAMMDSSAAGMGRDNIALNPIELGILMDLGYTVVPAPWFTYPPVAPASTPAPAPTPAL